jgi:hypothetical protein
VATGCSLPTSLHATNSPLSEPPASFCPISPMGGSTPHAHSQASAGEHTSGPSPSCDLDACPSAIQAQLPSDGVAVIEVSDTVSLSSLMHAVEAGDTQKAFKELGKLLGGDAAVSLLLCHAVLCWQCCRTFRPLLRQKSNVLTAGA